MMTKIFLRCCRAVFWASCALLASIIVAMCCIGAHRHPGEAVCVGLAILFLIMFGIGVGTFK
jgi:hypothetical protein